MRYAVTVERKPGLADPEGAVTKSALNSLGFDEVADVQFGKTLVIEVDDSTTIERVAEMCSTLLVNPVIEDYSIEQL